MATSKKRATAAATTKQRTKQNASKARPGHGPAVLWLTVVFTLLCIVFAVTAFVQY